MQLCGELHRRAECFRHLRSVQHAIASAEVVCRTMRLSILSSPPPRVKGNTQRSIYSFPIQILSGLSGESAPVQQPSRIETVSSLSSLAVRPSARLTTASNIFPPGYCPFFVATISSDPPAGSESPCRIRKRSTRIIHENSWFSTGCSLNSSNIS